MSFHLWQPFSIHLRPHRPMPSINLFIKCSTRMLNKAKQEIMQKNNSCVIISALINHVTHEISKEIKLGINATL